MVKELQNIIRSAWTAVYLDGRNEHGTHVLRLPQGTIDQSDHHYDPDEYAERIMAAAENVGHSAGHCVVVTWHYIDSEPSYWDIESEYQPELTELLFGTPADQARLPISAPK